MLALFMTKIKSPKSLAYNLSL